jgi:hypothetical protein
MGAKKRLRELRRQCADWDQIVGNFELCVGMSKWDAELGILALVDAGLIRIEPKPAGPTAFVLTTPEGIPEGVLSNVA